VLDSNFGEYDRVNTQFGETRDALDRIGQAIGKSFDPNSKFADAQVGTAMRGLFSNNKSRTNLLSTIDLSQETLRKYGVQLDEDIVRQAAFADVLERIYGSQAPTSFAGGIERAIDNAPSAVQGVSQAVRGDYVRGGFKVLGAGMKALRGINKNAQADALRALISVP
jgi:hypothetical protein